MTQKDHHDIFNIIGIIICLVGLFLLSGCKSNVQYIPVESVKTEYRDKLIRDSIYLKELVRIYQRGDTIFKDSIVYKYKDKLVKDTINITDTIRVPYPVKGDIIEVNKLKWYQEASVWFTSIALILITLFLLMKYRSRIFNFIKNTILRI